VSFFWGVSGFVGVVGAFCCFWACSWALGLFVLLVYCLCTGAPFAFLIKLLITYQKKKKEVLNLQIPNFNKCKIQIMVYIFYRYL
jgi:hypothetical protein